MNAPLAVKKSYLATQRSTVKKFVKAFADATRFIVDNKEGTMRPLTQLATTRKLSSLPTNICTPIQRRRSTRPIGGE